MEPELTPEDHAALVASHQGNLEALEARSDATAKRRAEEVRDELRRLGALDGAVDRAATRQSRPRRAVEKRG